MTETQHVTYDHWRREQSADHAENVVHVVDVEADDDRNQPHATTRHIENTQRRKNENLKEPRDADVQQPYALPQNRNMQHEYPY